MPKIGGFDPYKEEKDQLAYERGLSTKMDNRKTIRLHGPSLPTTIKMVNTRRSKTRKPTLAVVTFGRRKDQHHG